MHADERQKVLEIINRDQFHFVAVKAKTIFLVLMNTRLIFEISC